MAKPKRPKYGGPTPPTPTPTPGELLLRGLGKVAGFVQGVVGSMGGKATNTGPGFQSFLQGGALPQPKPSYAEQLRSQVGQAFSPRPTPTAGGRVVTPSEARYQAAVANYQLNQSQYPSSTRKPRPKPR